MKKMNKSKLILAFSVGLVIALLIGSTLNKSPKAPLKDGSPVIFESDFGQVSQKEYYDMLNTSEADVLIYAKFENDLLSSIKKDEGIIEDAKKQVSLVLENSKPEDLDGMKAELEAMGYYGDKAMQTFFENMMYRDRVATEYVTENMDALFPAYQEESKARTVSHILIKVEDVNNPTAEETANLKAIRQRILDGEDFATVAKEVSVDTSKEQGGALGLMDASTPFVPQFLKAALEQEASQIYDWVQSEYGFHLILVNDTDPDVIKKMDGLASMMVQSTPKISVTIMQKIMVDADVKFSDEAFEARLNEIIESVA